MIDAEPHLARLRQATDFDTAFAAVKDFVADAGPEQAQAQAQAWCASPEWQVQAAGLDVLGVVALNHAAAAHVLLEQVLRVAAEGNSEDLRWSATHALSSATAPDDAVQGQILAQLLRFQDDRDGDVRWQVVAALPGLAGEQPEATHPAVEALIRRLADPDGQVRDWAAFGLGLLDEVDSPEIRQALLGLLDDPEGDTAGEAAVALALRHEPGVLPVVLTELDKDNVGNLWVEAASELADPRLLPALLRLQAQDWARDDPRGHLLAEAIDRVTPHAFNPARPDQDPGPT
jgi:hypothetical protein